MSTKKKAAPGRTEDGFGASAGVHSLHHFVWRQKTRSRAKNNGCVNKTMDFLFNLCQHYDMLHKTIIENLRDHDSDALLADGFDEAIVGVTHGGQVIYCKALCVEILVRRDHMAEETAREFLEFNTYGAFVGPMGPVFADFEPELVEAFRVANLPKATGTREYMCDIRRYSMKKKKWAGKTVRIFSGEGGSYWRPRGGGYTTDIKLAWVLPFEEAFEETKHCDPSKRIMFEEVA